jgi:hypothetical protein
MTEWKQSDFKEKLMLYLLRSSDAIGDQCPDAESLIAFSEITSDSEKYELIQTHLDSCPECSEIHRLLSRFEDADALLPESEWKNVEKRLGNWMESFLPAESATAQIDQTHQARLWERLWGWIRVRQIRYALTTTTALVLVAGTGFYWLYRTPEPSPVASVARVKISPPKASQEASPTTEMGSSRPPEIRSAVSAFQEQNTSHLKASQESLPIIELGSSKPTGIPDLTRANASGSQVPLPATSVISSVPLSTLQIEVGTGMRVRVDSVLKDPDGSAIFRGSLVQPLVKGGKEVLSANSTVVANGRVSGREVILRVAEIRAPLAQSPPGRITRYVLMLSEAQPNVRSAEPESLDELSPGATIELRFVTPSTYLIEADRPR